MANYTVTHYCGHTQAHQISGPTNDREKRIAWLEGQICTECWKKEQAEKRKKQPLAAEIILNHLNGGAVIAVTEGDTYSIKEALKAAGFRWREYYKNQDFLGMSKPKKAWIINIDPDNEGMINTIGQKLFEIGVKK